MAAALANQNAVEAAKHATAALKAMPDDSDAKQLLGDALAGAGDFTGALTIYEELFAAGANVPGSKIHVVSGVASPFFVTRS